MSEFKPIIITINDLDKPPLISIDGVETEGMVEVNYEYETRDQYSSGTHRYQIKYGDKQEKLIKTIGHERL